MDVSIRFARACISCAVLLQVSVVIAQQPSSPEEAARLQEVVVTAQRREEFVQRIPIAVTALSADELNEQGVTGVAELDNLVPNLQVGDVGRGSTEIFVRGIGSTNNTEVGDPAIAFNVDGVYMARSRSAAGLFFDLDRVEVLRGPQGTLYGRNATAGSINIITKKPTNELEGTAQVEYGSYSLVRAFGALNVPLSDRLAFRAAVQRQKRSGFTNNSVRDDYNDEDALAGRAHLKFDASDALTVLLTGDYFRNGGVGSAAGPLGGSELDGDPFTYPVTAEGWNRQQIYGATLTTDWQLPIGALTYVGAYHRDESRWFGGGIDQVGGNATGASLDDTVNCAAKTNPSACSRSTFFSDEYSTSHELRLAGASDRLQWTGGLYYFKEHNDVLLYIAPIAGIGSLTFDQPDVNADSRAAFAQLKYSLRPQLRLTGGLRYTKDHKARVGGTLIGATLSGKQSIGGTVITANISDIDWSSTDWKAGVEYDVGPSSMAYFTAGTGYKAGGYGDGAPPLVYGPERLMAYEVGWKNRLRHDTIQVNAASFYYDYRDFQVSAVGQIAGQAALITINAQKAEVYGAELETQVLLSEHDHLDFNLSYLHAKYTDFVLPCGDQFGQPVPAGYVPPPGCAAGAALRLPQDYTGNALARSPKWNATFGYQHDWRFGNGATFGARLQSHYESRKNLDYHGFPLTEQGAFTRTDFSLLFTAPQKRWSAMAYVRNLEDHEVLVFAQPRSNAPVSRTSGTGRYAMPRTYGLQLTATF